MKSLVAALMMAVPVTALAAETWLTCKNDKYKYEIRYPDTYEIVITGPQNESDGKILRIARKEDARGYGVTVEIYPDMSLAQIMAQVMLKMRAPELSEIESGDVAIHTELHKLIWTSTTVNGAPAVRMQIRFTANDQLYKTFLIMDQAVITANLWPHASFDEEFAERIISTFKWETEVPDNPTQVKLNSRP